jgi:hypothetical protein
MELRNNHGAIPRTASMHSKDQLHHYNNISWTKSSARLLPTLSRSSSTCWERRFTGRFPNACSNNCLYLTSFTGRYRTSTQVANWFSNKRSPPKVPLKKDEAGPVQCRKFDVGEHQLYSVAGIPGRRLRLRPQAAYLGNGNPESVKEFFEPAVLVVKTRALMRLAA